MNNKVNLFLVGAAKAGTTSMHNYLIKSREIDSSFIKEPFFFTDRRGLTKGKRNLNWDTYHNLYSFSNEQFKFHLDSSVSYLCFPEVAKDIYTYNPDAKILIMLRDPIQRYLSYYKMYLKRENLKTSPEEFLLEETFLPKLEAGLYHKSLIEYFKYFKENVHVIIFEDLLENPQKIEKELNSFLGINTVSLTINQKFNESNRERFQIISDFIHKDNKLKDYLKRFPLPLKLRKDLKSFLQNMNETNNKVSFNLDEEFMQYLVSYYKEDVKKTQNLLGETFNKWNNYY